MVTEDWKGYIVTKGFRSELQSFGGYNRIFQGLGIKDVEVVILEEGSQECARKLGDLVRSSSKKPIVTCFGHDLIAYLSDDSDDVVNFDAHSDDYGEENLNHGSFVRFMRGRHICIGARESDYFDLEKRKPILLRYETPELIAKFPFRNQIFLSIDTDVFDPKVTTAHSIGDMTPYEGRMFPNQVSDLLRTIAANRTLTGIAIAEYYPFYEGDKTDEIFVNLLKPIL